MIIDLDQRPCVNRHARLQWEPSQSSYVLLYPEGMVKLNSSAGEILRECDGRRSVEEICERLQQRYPEAKDLRGEICAFFADTDQNGWTCFV